MGVKILSVFGTRPEATKMAPLVKCLEAADGIESIVCVTAQHREMLDQVLELFEIVPDYDLDIMSAGQTLSQITNRVLDGMGRILETVKPDMILVHGDTSTTFAGALSAFYHKVKVGHVEAGLRTDDKWSPYPEEMNRNLTAKLADIHFCPTNNNVQNLIKENVDEKTIYITGNTAIDAMKLVVKENYVFNNELDAVDFDHKKIIVMTAHRSENIGQPMKNFFGAIHRVVEKNKDVEVIYPVHLNPKVRVIANEIFGDNDRIHLIEPLEYEAFANLMDKAYMIMTDSGGLQEEAPFLGKPILVLRKETERPEAIEAGTAKLAGVEEDRVYKLATELLHNKEEYNRMAGATNPYGAGDSADQIVQIIKNYFQVY